MEITQFIIDIADQFDETAIEEFQEITVFRELSEWSSLTGLAVLIMIGRDYGVRLSPEDFKTVTTIKELFELVQSKRQYV